MRSLCLLSALGAITLAVGGANAGGHGVGLASETEKDAQASRFTALASGSPGRWDPLPPMPVPRLGLAAATGSDGRIYALGGDRATRRVDWYDPGRGVWGRGADMPSPRAAFAAVTAADGRIYAIGGATKPGARGAHRLVDAYDPRTDRWERRAPMSTPRAGLAAVVGSDRRIYAIGGQNENRRLRALEIYDPSNNTWSRGAPMPTARTFLAAASLGNRIWTVGGAQGIRATATVEIYDRAANSWRTGPRLPRPRIFHAATRGADGRPYVLGGELPGPDWITGSVLVSDSLTRRWQNAPDMLAQRIQPAATTGLDGRIYVLGGCICEREPLAEVFTPAGATGSFSNGSTVTGGVVRADKTRRRDAAKPGRAAARLNAFEVLRSEGSNP